MFCTNVVSSPEQIRARNWKLTPYRRKYFETRWTENGVSPLYSERGPSLRIIVEAQSITPLYLTAPPAAFDAFV